MSITAEIRVPKIDPGKAVNAYSLKIFDPNIAVCPDRAQFDTYGRQAPFASLQAYGPGNCFSAQDRLAVENSVSRPLYSTFLNIGGISGTSTAQLSKRKYRGDNSDTMGVRRPEAFMMYGEKRIKPFPTFRGGIEEEAEYMTDIMAPKNVGYIVGVN